MELNNFEENNEKLVEILTYESIYYKNSLIALECKSDIFRLESEPITLSTRVIIFKDEKDQEIQALYIKNYD